MVTSALLAVLQKGFLNKTCVGFSKMLVLSEALTSQMLYSGSVSLSGLLSTFTASSFSFSAMNKKILTSNQQSFAALQALNTPVVYCWICIIHIFAVPLLCSYLVYLYPIFSYAVCPCCFYSIALPVDFLLSLRVDCLDLCRLVNLNHESCKFFIISHHKFYTQTNSSTFIALSGWKQFPFDSEVQFCQENMVTQFTFTVFNIQAGSD